MHKFLMKIREGRARLEHSELGNDRQYVVFLPGSDGLGKAFR